MSLLIEPLLRLRGFCDCKSTLSTLIFFFNLDACFLMKFSHESGDIATTIITEQLLVKQTVFLIVIEL